uniref:Uncharacterized protein n=1 Tax=Clytia hemisphaerica TaxID=252671 RepID=A0A7M5WJM7_9CNID
MLANQKQSFLPSILKEVERREEANLEKNLKWWRLYSDWRFHGFDSTNRYYTALDEQKSDYPFFDIAVLYYDDNESKVKRLSVTLCMEISPQEDGLLYDHESCRWFNIETIWDIEGFQTTLYSGTVGHLFPEVTSPTYSEQISVSTREVNDQNKLVDFPLDLTLLYSAIKKSQSIGDVLLLCFDEESGYDNIYVSLIKFDEQGITLYKSITIPIGEHQVSFSDHSIGLDWHDEHVDPNIFLDFEAERIYFTGHGGPRDDYDCHLTLLSCFDFSGKHLFSFTVGDDKTKSESFSFFTQVHGSVFVSVTSHKMVQLLKVTEKGILTMKESQLYINVEFNVNYTNYRAYRLMKQFERYLLCVGITTRNERYEAKSTSYFVFDISNGEKVYHCVLDGPRVWKLVFNKDMSELMYRSSDIHGIFNFRKSTLIDGTSLKHKARLACLKSFTDEYLSSKLPKHLLQYLGITC